MEPPKPDDPAHERLFKQATEHLETRLELFGLTITERASAVVANLAGVMVIFLFAVLVLFFFSMGFAWWLGDFFGSRAGGFALAGLIFVPLGYFAFRVVRPAVRSIIIEIALDATDGDEPKTGEK